MLGRNGIPGFQKSVIDALFGVGSTSENIQCDGSAVGTVSCSCGIDGARVTGEVLGDDFSNLHVITSFHLYTRNRQRNLTYISDKNQYITSDMEYKLRT